MCYVYTAVHLTCNFLGIKMMCYSSLFFDQENYKAKNSKGFKSYISLFALTCCHLNNFAKTNANSRFPSPLQHVWEGRGGVLRQDVQDVASRPRLQGHHLWPPSHPRPLAGRHLSSSSFIECVSGSGRWLVCMEEPSSTIHATIKPASALSSSPLVHLENGNNSRTTLTSCALTGFFRSCSIPCTYFSTYCFAVGLAPLMYGVERLPLMCESCKRVTGVQFSGWLTWGVRNKFFLL